MIRFVPSSFRHRYGLSIAETAYALLVIGVVLGFLWLKVAAVYENMEVTQASRQLSQMVLATRAVHVSDKITTSENLDLLNLPSDMVGHFHGQAIVFNPWRGRVTLFPGNAIGDGYDKINDEFTIRYDGVPRSACTDLVMESASQTLNLGLTALYISSQDGKGKEICFGQDSVCKNVVSGLMRNQIDVMCQEKSRMNVMFTFAAH